MQSRETENRDPAPDRESVLCKVIKTNYAGDRNSMANVISGIRIVCGLFLFFCVPFSKWFYLFYLLGGVSDVLDGYVARRTGTESDFGAKLDTAADIVFFAAVLTAMMKAVRFPLWLTVWIIAVAVIKCVNVISGFVLCKRFVAAHTGMNKLCGVLFFIVPLCINRVRWQAVAVLILLTCIAATFAAMQEGHYIRSEKADQPKL